MLRWYLAINLADKVHFFEVIEIFKVRSSLYCHCVSTSFLVGLSEAMAKHFKFTLLCHFTSLGSSLEIQSLNARYFNYANVSEHCNDLWSFKRNDEAPMVGTNGTLFAANATGGTPTFCHVEGQVAIYVGVTLRLPASGADWDGIYYK